MQFVPVRGARHSSIVTLLQKGLSRKALQEPRQAKTVWMKSFCKDKQSQEEYQMTSQSQSEMSKKAVNVGQLLLCYAKCVDRQSAEDLDKIDCVRLESVRSDGVSRAVHRCILEVGSEIFAQDIHKLRTSRGQEWSNTLRVDMSIYILDMVVEYLYTREPIQVFPALAIELYAVARRFGLIDVIEQVEEFWRSNHKTFLESEVFWNTSHCAADVELFFDVVESCPLDSAHKMLLMQRVQQWSIGDPEKIETASKLFHNMLSQSEVSTLQPEPTASNCWETLLALGTYSPGNTSNQYIFLFLKKHFLNDNSLFSQTLPNDATTPHDQSFIPSDREDFKCQTIESNCSYQSVIINNQIYSPFKSELNVYSLKSKRLISTTKYSSNCHFKDDMCIFKEEVFFYTSNTIYRLNAQERKLTSVLKLDKDTFIYKVTVLEHNHEKTVFAVQTYFEKNIFIYSTDVKKNDKAFPIKIHKFPPDSLLIGSYKGLLYFVPDIATKNSFYVALREDVEVKRRYLGCDKVITGHIHNELFSCIGYVNDEMFLLVTDLSTDTILFRRPLTDLNSTFRYSRVIPVVGECSDLQSTE